MIRRLITLRARRQLPTVSADRAAPRARRPTPRARGAAVQAVRFQVGPQCHRHAGARGPLRRPLEGRAVRRAHQVAARQHEPAALPPERPALRGDLRHMVAGLGREVRSGLDRARGPGTYVYHKAKGIHYDGAKNEEVVIQVWGIGPDGNTPAEKK